MSQRTRIPVVTLCSLMIVVCAMRPAQAWHNEHDLTAKTDSAAAGLTSPNDVPPDIVTVYAKIQADYQAVKPLFVKGCYDCHSANTRYPWYHKLPLVKGLIDSDVRKARKHVDYTDGFPFKGHARPADDLLAIRNEVTEGEMPPLLYRMMHWNAKPSDTELKTIVTWLDNSLRLLAAHGQYPFDRPDLVPAEGQGIGEDDDSDDD